MIILIIMSGFFPGKKFGGPPVSIDNFCTLLKQDCNCHIITHNHDMGETQPYSGISKGWNNRENAKVLYLSDKEYNYHSFAKIIQEIKPNCIYLQGLFQECIFPCLWIAKKKNIKVILAPRGELCSGSFHKRYKKIPYIFLLKLFRLLEKVSFQSTSEDETNGIMRYLSVNPERIHYLSNIPSLPQKKYPNREKHSGVGRFVFISRIHPKKNLLQAINTLKETYGSSIFDIYGPIEDKDYWDQCNQLINNLPSNIKVSYKGVIDHTEIHNTFSQYDAFIFPTLSENYGHVIAECLLSECIPIISDQTPWTDINEANAGWAIPLNNQDAYYSAVQSIINLNEEEIQLKRNSIRNYLNDKLQLERLRDEYLEVFQSV